MKNFILYCAPEERFIQQLQAGLNFLEPPENCTIFIFTGAKKIDPAIFPCAVQTFHDSDFIDDKYYNKFKALDYFLATHSFDILPNIALLDCDTVVIGALDIFEFRHYESQKIWACYDDARLGVEHDPTMPLCLPEFNTGVLYFPENMVPMAYFKTESFHERIKKYYFAAPDQSAFRKFVMAENMVTALPPEYNFRADHAAFASGPVKIIHLHDLIFDQALVTKLLALVNSHLGMRCLLKKGDDFELAICSNEADGNYYWYVKSPSDERK